MKFKVDLGFWNENGCYIPDYVYMNYKELKTNKIEKILVKLCNNIALICTVMKRKILKCGYRPSKKVKT